MTLPNLDIWQQIVDKTGHPTPPFHIWWQEFIKAQNATNTSLQNQINTVTGLNGSVTAALTAADDSILVSSGVVGATLTASDAGTTATISVSAHARMYGNGSTVSVTAGTVTSLAFSTEYYVYYDQPTRVGGAVTYLATTNKMTAVQTGDRHFVGTITTPADGAANTTGTTPEPPGFGFLPATVATTIANDVVTNAKLANVNTATFKGRVTAGTGDPEDLTGTQATTLLDTFTSSLKGLAPASGGGTTNFLRADGTWTAPGGGSDPWTWLKLAINNTVSTTAFADVTGMSFTALANTTYLVHVYGAYQTAATTTGIALTLNTPAGAIVGNNLVLTSATTNGGTEVITSNSSTGATTGVRAANTNTPIQAFFVVQIGGTGGTVQLRQRSEVAASNTVLQAGLTIMGYRAV